ncbi:CU044_5270 family protein [Streptomyces sp. NPDC048301]|uniref:CU044_5270 family protein n=1 Tax=Streptomyces sp. NPDC048301 TaxID=3155631 RepID=UPI003432B7EA
MNELTALRELESEVPALTEEARSAARSRLTGAIAKERGRSPVPSRRLVLRAAFTATAAAAAAGVYVAATREPGDGVRLHTLSAAQVLRRAADRTRAQGAGITVPRGDQYLYSREVYTRTMLRSGKRTTHTDEFWISEDGSRTSRYVYDGRIKDEPPLTKHQVAWPPTQYAKLRKLPTDPDGLLKALGHAEFRTEDGARMAYTDLLLLMRGPRVMPPGLQAAAFEAFAKLPGIVIEDSEVDALGRHGIGVSHRRESIGLVFERGTYAYLGLRLEGVKGARPVGKELRGGEKYLEVGGLVASGVVDEIGQRPR